MSIYIGNTPIYQPQSTNLNIRSSTNSNIIALGSETSNVFMRMGDYIIGQQRTSNALEFRILNNQSQPLAIFGNNAIRLFQPLITTGVTQFTDQIILSSNLNVNTVIASNLFISNGVKNVISLDVDGNIYLDGNLNFGTNSSNYQLYLNSNIFVGGSITARELYTPLIGNNSNLQSYISLTSNTIRLAADVVQIDNLNILGVNNFETIRVRDDSYLDGEISASNLVLYNKTSTSDPNRNALRIIQKLNAGEYADFRVGNPIAVYADFKGGLNNESIFQVTPVGQLLLGTNTEVTGSDRTNYLIQANIPAQRWDLIEGFLDYKNSNIDKDRFTVNRNGLVAIGKNASDSAYQNSMLDIVNNYSGEEQYYVKPTSMITLTNKFSSNALPYLKCVDHARSNIFQITSNGTLCFYNTPINPSYYDIESQKTALFQALETDRIYNSNNKSISFEETTLSNISSVLASNITSEYATINFATINNLYAPNLEISLPYFEAYNFNSEIRLLTDRFLTTAYNVAINADATYFETITPSLCNLTIFTTGLTTDTVYPIYSIGNNTDITNTLKNTNATVNSRVTNEFTVDAQMFKTGVIKRAGDYVMYMTPDNASDILNANGAINIFNDKRVKFNNATMVLDSGGRVAIGQSTVESYNLYTKGTFAVADNDTNIQLTVNAAGAVGVGTNTPLAKLHVLQTGTQASLRVDDVASDTTPFIIDANGNVGIGTILPRATVDIQSPILVGTHSSFGLYNPFGIAYLRRNTKPHLILEAIGSATGAIVLDDSNGMVYNSDATIGDHVFRTGGFWTNDMSTTGTERVRITRNGNVGIGTSTPIELLNVEGNIALSGGNRFIGTRTNHSLSLRTNNTTQLTLDTSGNLSFGSRNGQLLNLYGTTYAIGVQPSTTYFRSEDGAFGWYKGGVYANSGAGTGGSTYMFMNTSGNLGIGTATPKQRLDVEGNMSITGNILPSACNVYSIGSSNLRFKDIYLSGNTIDLGGTLISRNIDTGAIVFKTETNQNLDIIARNASISGKVAIGNGNGNNIEANNSAISLELLGTDAVLLPKGNNTQRPSGVKGYIRYNTELDTFEGFGAGNTWGSLGGVKSTDQNTYITAENGNNIRFYTGGIQRAILNPNGNLGIGTNTPTTALDVVGTVTATRFVGAITGTVSGSVDTLSNPRLLWGQSFNGSEDVSGNIIGAGTIQFGTQANKATITYTADTARTFTIPDPLQNANFVMSEGAQNINGVKTFGSVPSLPSQSANQFFASPSTGSGAPSFRSIASADLPTVNIGTTAVPLSRASGNLALTGITSIDGNAASASTIAITNDTTTNATHYITFSSGTSGNQATKITSTKLTYNPSTGVLASTGGFSGALTGNVTGNVTGSSGSCTGNADNVTGTVAVANGGTGVSTVGSGNQFFSSPNGSSGAPSFRSIASADLPTVNIGTTAVPLSRASGNLALTGITSIDGTAANATNIAITNDTTTNATHYITFSSGTSGNQAAKITSTKLTYNPSTGVLASTGGFSGALTGNVTGNVTGSSGSCTGNAANVTGTVAVANGGTGVSTVGSGNQFFSSPNGSSGAPSFRSIASADLPTVNIGTTAVPLSRASGNLALTGITSIDGTAAGLSGSPNITVGTITFGTQANKATLTYTTNTARTYTIPDVNASSFVMTEGNQTINGTKTFGTVPSLPSQTANFVFAAPNGTAGVPTFRALVAADLPAGFGASVTLTDSVSTTSSTIAASATAVKTANDNANGRVPTSRNITAGTGLTGGGSLASDVTLSINSTVFNSGSAVSGNLRFGSGNGTGVRFWDDDSYKIWMSDTADATWGGRLDADSDYNMYFRMTAGTNRGFVFKNSTTNIAQIRGNGDFYFTGTMQQGTVPNARTTATSLSNGNTIVARDGSGNFIAGTITATLSGTATNATNITITNDTTTNSTHYITYSAGTSGNNGTKVSSTKLTFNPSTGILTATGFSGPLTGNVTGNVTGSSGSCTGNAANVTGIVALVNGGTGNTTGNAATVTNGVYTEGAQTINGVKTFSSAPVISTTTENVTFVNSGTTKRGITGTSGDNDQWFFGGGATASDSGFLEIATGDNGTEPIHVRQYSGSPASGGTITRTATLLDASGNTNFPGTLTATAFSGPLTGNVTGNVTGSSGSCTGNSSSATNVAITDDTSTNSTHYITYSSGTSGNNASKVSSTKLTFNPSTGTLTATAFSGPLTGNVTGNVTGSSGSCTGNSSSATNVAITDDTSTNSTHYITYSAGTSGNNASKVSSTKLTFNPSTGTLTAGGDVVAFSDSNIKCNLIPIENALDKIVQLTGYTFNYTDRENDTRHAGLLAQDVEKVLPEVVHTNQDGILSLAYGNMSALIINAIKELQQDVQKIKAVLNIS